MGTVKSKGKENKAIKACPGCLETEGDTFELLLSNPN